MNQKSDLKYSEAAELRTLTEPQWFCKVCNRFWGNDERMARYCCSKNSECDDCGCEIPKHHCKCNSCEQKHQNERWSAKPEKVWNGEFPLHVWDDDKFFWSIEELADYLHDVDIDENEGETELDVLRSLKFTSCRPTTPRAFCVSDLFDDCLGEDQEPPENDELDKLVNDWIKSVLPVSWEPTGDRLRVAEIEQAYLEHLRAIE